MGNTPFRVYEFIYTEEELIIRIFSDSQVNANAIMAAAVKDPAKFIAVPDEIRLIIGEKYKHMLNQMTVIITHCHPNNPDIYTCMPMDMHKVLGPVKFSRDSAFAKYLIPVEDEV